MSSLQQGTLNFNKNCSVNFNGGKIASDGGLILSRAFTEIMNLRKILEIFNDSARRNHTFAKIIEQLIFSYMAGYSSDKCADDLKHDPLMTCLLDKETLASQPTISRFVNAMDETSLEKFHRVQEKIFELGNPVDKTNHIILDLDSTLFGVHGKQKESAFNVYYGSKGYHPLVLYNGLNGDLMKIELRKGSVYTSKDIEAFLRPVLEWLTTKYPDATLLVRGDSGFATPDLYNLCDEFSVEHVIRLKANSCLSKLSKDTMDHFMELYGRDYSKDHVMYSDFEYTADSWSYPQRVVCKVERGADELAPRTTYIVTTLKAAPETVTKAYNKRGNMENFIKESKIDFFMDSVSHSEFLANAIKTMIKAIAYNIINIMKRTVFPKDRASSRMLSIRADIIKIACRTVKSARRTIFKLSSSSPYKKVFNQIMHNINQFKLE